MSDYFRGSSLSRLRYQVAKDDAQEARDRARTVPPLPPVDDDDLHPIASSQEPQERRW